MLIDGAAGALEVEIHAPEQQEKIITAKKSVVLCHPHPLFGGSMQNKVIYSLAKAATKEGYQAVRFNFRGVGASEGTFDQGQGEQQDLRVLLEFLRENDPSDSILLTGFSFGAFVCAEVARLSSSQGPISALCLVAPPIKRMPFEEIHEYPEPLCVIAAEQDELVPIEYIETWIEPQHASVNFQKVAGASHFFHGKLRVLCDYFSDFLRTI